LTSPTEDNGSKKARRQVAVALKADQGDVPKVVASGYGSTAERILALAFESGIKVREDADLAEMLAAIELDARIPLTCFEAVAEILNYLYRLNNMPLPDFMTEVPEASTASPVGIHP
jgi:flagellar biosynthesis protein